MILEYLFVFAFTETLDLHIDIVCYIYLCINLFFLSYLYVHNSSMFMFTYLSSALFFCYLEQSNLKPESSSFFVYTYLAEKADSDAKDVQCQGYTSLLFVV